MLMKILKISQEDAIFIKEICIYRTGMVYGGCCVNLLIKVENV